MTVRHSHRALAGRHGQPGQRRAAGADSDDRAAECTVGRLDDKVEFSGKLRHLAPPERLSEDVGIVPHTTTVGSGTGGVR